MSKKVKRKVALPKDRTGKPIHVGDVLQWDDGRRMKVAMMTYYGDGWWTAEDEDGDFSDNLGASVIVWRKPGKEHTC